MPSNVEIKAKLGDKQKAISIARDISGEEGRLGGTNFTAGSTHDTGTLLEQADTFYMVPNGRLKLRVEGGCASGKLISYSRPDQAGPKLSKFTIARVESAADLNEVLTESLGFIGRVEKKRLLFMVGQTRVHIDSVSKLGDFLELEVMMKDGQSLEDGQRIAKELMDKLGVEGKDLITGAYMDLLIKK